MRYSNLTLFILSYHATSCPKFFRRILVESGTFFRQALIARLYISLNSYFVITERCHVLNPLGVPMIDLEPLLVDNSNLNVWSLLDLGSIMGPILFIKVIIRPRASYGDFLIYWITNGSWASYRT